jgi:uncharacterized protein
MVWFHKAADAGDAEAMTKIGFSYEQGYGVAQDQEQAVTWYRKAAALGEENAKKRLTALGIQ